MRAYMQSEYRLSTFARAQQTYASEVGELRSQIEADRHRANSMFQGQQEQLVTQQQLIQGLRGVQQDLSAKLAEEQNALATVLAQARYVEVTASGFEAQISNSARAHQEQLTFEPRGLRGRATGALWRTVGSGPGTPHQQRAYSAGT